MMTPLIRSIFSAALLVVCSATEPLQARELMQASPYASTGSIVYDLSDLEMMDGALTLNPSCCPCRPARPRRVVAANMNQNGYPSGSDGNVNGDSRYYGKPVNDNYSQIGGPNHSMNSSPYDRCGPPVQTCCEPQCGPRSGTYVQTVYEDDPGCYCSDATWDGWYAYGLFSSNHFSRQCMPGHCYHYMPNFGRGQWHTITTLTPRYLKRLYPCRSH